MRDPIFTNCCNYRWSRLLRTDSTARLRLLPVLVVNLLLTSVCAMALADNGNDRSLILEDFETYSHGEEPQGSGLRRVEQVTVTDGGSELHSGRAAHFLDDSDHVGVLEYVVGSQGVDTLFVEFDVINNKSVKSKVPASLIFSVGPWNSSQGILLNAAARRAFGLELHQSGGGKNLGLRVGNSMLQRGAYDHAKPQNVKVWVNDREKRGLAYIRPDNGEEAILDPNSFVVWINGQLISREPASGYPMLAAATVGDAGIGRIGFNSSTSGRADFTIDNLRVEAATDQSASPPRQVVSRSARDRQEITPTSLNGAETIAYRSGENSMNLFVFKPKDWRATDRRSALVYFFGGGWTKGSPVKAESWARWAAAQGMVGIAPDYRTHNRFGTSPLESVADGRAAYSWVVAHADELGIDPHRIAVGGTSAGGHVALWTAISPTPPGSSQKESPAVKPALLFLSSAVTDTSTATGYTPNRFGEHAEDLSPVHRLDVQMPPLLMFHAVDDELVHYSTAVNLCEKLAASGNQCELVSVPRGGHGYSKGYPEWKSRVRTQVEKFLAQYKLLPAG